VSALECNARNVAAGALAAAAQQAILTLYKDKSIAELLKLDPIKLNVGTASCHVLPIVQQVSSANETLSVDAAAIFQRP
jgi:hypothetical protein